MHMQIYNMFHLMYLIYLRFRDYLYCNIRVKLQVKLFWSDLKGNVLCTIK